MKSYTYPATSTCNPSPSVELPAHLWDQVCGMLGIRGLNKMVIVVVIFVAVRNGDLVRGFCHIARVLY